ncbi:DUF6923 family protein [Thiothrix eikelboomii]|uniref:DUF6923 family protein n=1 Tax=Thiothrix eikelboomii TaxID=92487 RepID=UPI00389AC447
MYGTNGRTAIVDLNNHTLQNLPNNVGKEVNGFGYRASDDFLYGFDVTNQNLIRIDATGQGTDLGAHSSCSGCIWSIRLFIYPQ